MDGQSSAWITIEYLTEEDKQYHLHYRSFPPNHLIIQGCVTASRNTHASPPPPLLPPPPPHRCYTTLHHITTHTATASPLPQLQHYHQNNNSPLTNTLHSHTPHNTGTTIQHHKHTTTTTPISLRNISYPLLHQHSEITPPYHTTTTNTSIPQHHRTKDH